MFLTLILTGLRRHELQALRWRDVDLLKGVLRVRDSKTEDGIRSIALSSRLVDALAEQWQRTAFRGDDELVFAHPRKGSAVTAKWFTKALRASMRAAGVDGANAIRAFHDLRHTGITNDAASGSSAIAVISKAGHADMKTTKRHLHLAGVVFRSEADTLENRMLGTADKSRQSAVESSADLSASDVISAD